MNEANVTRVKNGVLWYLEGRRPYIVAGFFYTSVLLMSAFAPNGWSLYSEILLAGGVLAAVSGYTRRGVIPGISLGASPYLGDLSSSVLLFGLHSWSLAIDQALLVSRLIPVALVYGISAFLLGYFLRTVVEKVQQNRGYSLAA